MGHKKWITAIILVSVLVIIAIKWRSDYNIKKLPYFDFKTVDSKNLKSRDLYQSSVNILLIHHVNSFTLAYIRTLIQASQGDPRRLVIFCADQFLLGQNEKATRTHIIKDFNAAQICNLFHLPKPKDNWILMYDRGFLVFRAIFNGSIVRKLGLTQAVVAPQLGRDNNIAEEVARLLSSYKPGVYFCAQRLVTSCACYAAFEFLMEELLKGGDRLRLLLIGEFSEIDVENFDKEEAGRIVIMKPNPEINQLVDAWRREVQILDFNAIIFLNKTSLRVMPLIDAGDYRKWLRFKESEYPNVVKAFRTRKLSTQ